LTGKLTGEAAYQVLPDLVQMMRQGEPVPGMAVVPAIRILGAQLAQPIPSLLEALEDVDPKVRGLAVVCLRDMRKKAMWAVPALQQRLKDADRNVRIRAALALVGMEADDDAAREVLIDAANAPEGWWILENPHRRPFTDPRKTQQLKARAATFFHMVEVVPRPSRAPY
jgi:hypothetical protein